MNILPIALIPFFLCWGSLLNTVAYRLVSYAIPLFFPRSLCPHCTTIIAWYENIPVVSWIFLQGRCSFCKQCISLLYPGIELITVTIFAAMIAFIEPRFWFAYFLFFSALIVSIRTDLETFLISRFATLFLVPFAFLFSYCGLLPISLTQSVIGAATAWILFSALAYGYLFIAKRVGIGQGDVELLTFIGAFIGFTGWWFSLLIASWVGTMVGLGMIIFLKKPLRSTKIPFGPFLALGALLTVFLQPYFLRLIY